MSGSTRLTLRVYSDGIAWTEAQVFALYMDLGLDFDREESPATALGIALRKQRPGWEAEVIQSGNAEIRVDLIGVPPGGTP